MTSQHTQVPRWTGAGSCPFCGESIPDPGAGFIEHTRDSTSCRRAFDGWRERIQNDMKGEWVF